MKWRRISEQDVLKVLDAPDSVEESIGERKNAFKLLSDRLPKVTYKEEGSDRLVITAIEKTRRGKRYENRV